jgi:hypothetical protein
VAVEAPAFDARGALVGALVMSGFGIGWALWGGGALSGTAAAVVQIAGLVIGLALIGVAASLLRRSPPGSGTSMVGTRSYWALVAGEFAAIAAGAAILAATDHARYVAALVAVVVGIHFLAFGHLFWSGFFVVGAVLLVGAAASVGLGLGGAGNGAVIGAATLVAAADLFGTSLLAIRAARAAAVAG